MTIFNSTKRALFFSVIALFICIIMLLGATYAWFTDNATSPDNQITAGNLNVELYHWTSATESTNISDSATPVFSNSIKWEPGRTEVVYLSVKNAGDLNLKYKVDLVVTSVSNDNLADVMEYSIVEGQYGSVTSWAGNGTKLVNAPGSNATDVADVELAPNAEKFYAIAIHMNEEAGNEYMGETITFDIDVLASQTTEETDAFGSDQYDKDATYSDDNNDQFTNIVEVTEGASAVTAEFRDENDTKVASVTVPSAAIAADVKKLSILVKPTDVDANFTVPVEGSDVAAFNVTVNGLVEGNTELIKVDLRIAAGLDPATVKLYHYNTLIPSSYNPSTGYVTFQSATFSPFTVVYDAESEYEAPEVDASKVPTATVTYAPEHVNTELPWGNFGQWSPTEGLDANLEAAFVFACPETLDPAFANWYCDFVVSLDKALGENQIFLGGNYGSFGWVGFHNGDVTLNAGDEIGLLEAVTTNPWTYADVYNFVGEFTCGVGDVENALNGATFTVKLRLTNPEDSAEYYDVNVVTHTFGGSSVIDGTTVVTNAEQLQNAIENAGDNTEIQLNGDIDLSDLANGL